MMTTNRIQIIHIILPGNVDPNKLTERRYMYNQSWSQLGSL